MKALKINVTDKSVQEVEIENAKDIYSHIGNNCRVFAVPYIFENGDALYCDDESLLNDTPPNCFMLSDFYYPLVGNAIILGTNDDGESIDVKSKKDDIQVSFFDSYLIALHAMESKN